MTIHWPFPSQDAPPQAYDLPAPRFAIGNRVTTRWGRGTVIAVHDWPNVSDSRAYSIRHDWSSGPEGFGHIFGEVDIELLASPALSAEAEQAPTVDDAPANETTQLELFS